MSNQDMVREFYLKHGLSCDRPYPSSLSPTQALRRIRLMHEELSEFIQAASYDHIIGMADALGDMLYVIYGTAVEMGIDLDAVFAEIHRSNMTKTPGAKDNGGKILKGPNYQAPSLESILFRGTRVSSGNPHESNFQGSSTAV